MGSDSIKKTYETRTDSYLRSTLARHKAAHLRHHNNRAHLQPYIHTYIHSRTCIHAYMHTDTACMHTYIHDMHTYTQTQTRITQHMVRTSFQNTDQHAGYLTNVCALASHIRPSDHMKSSFITKKTARARKQSNGAYIFTHVNEYAAHVHHNTSEQRCIGAPVVVWDERHALLKLHHRMPSPNQNQITITLNNLRAHIWHRRGSCGMRKPVNASRHASSKIK